MTDTPDERANKLKCPTCGRDDLTLNEFFKLARKAKGVTLREVEKQTGVSNALISQIENSHVLEPGYFTVKKLLEYYEIKGGIKGGIEP